MATHSSVIAWRIPGTGEPGGLLSMGGRTVPSTGLSKRDAVISSFFFLLSFNKTVLS